MKYYLTIKSHKANQKLLNFVKETRKEFDNFFQITNVSEPLVFLINERKDMDLIWGNKTENWFVGAAKNNSIYIFNPKIFSKVSIHKKEKFWVTLKHEYCHIYYSQITKSHLPCWLNEGLASYLSGKKLILKESNQDKLLDVFKYFNKWDKDGYMIGQFWVELLLKKFGRKKLLLLIKNFPQSINKRQFANLFYKIYGFKFDKNFFEKFLY